MLSRGEGEGMSSARVRVRARMRRRAIAEWREEGLSQDKPVSTEGGCVDDDAALSPLSSPWHMEGT